jgi:hypothetical protein
LNVSNVFVLLEEEDKVEEKNCLDGKCHPIAVSPITICCHISRDDRTQETLATVSCVSSAFCKMALPKSSPLPCTDR